MKAICKKISAVLKIVFGYGILFCLFTGGMTFFCYLAALFVGGEAAVAICAFTYKTLIPIVIKVSTVMVLLGLVAMYLNGEMALTTNKKKAAKHEGEL